MENKTSNDSLIAKPKRGRQPIGERAMTAAERKRRSRKQLAASGTAEFSLRLKGDMLEFINNMAKHTNRSRADVLEGILLPAIVRNQLAIRLAHQMADAGSSKEQIAVEMYRIMPIPGVVEPTDEMIKTICVAAMQPKLDEIG
jgi:hypothetical protein